MLHAEDMCLVYLQISLQKQAHCQELQRVNVLSLTDEGVML